MWVRECLDCMQHHRVKLKSAHRAFIQESFIVILFNNYLPTTWCLLSSFLHHNNTELTTCNCMSGPVLWSGDGHLVAAGQHPHRQALHHSSVPQQHDLCVRRSHQVHLLLRPHRGLLDTRGSHLQQAGMGLHADPLRRRPFEYTCRNLLKQQSLVSLSLQESSGMSVCNGKIFILGGRGENGEATDTILCYDPSTGIITGVAAMPRPISYHGCVTIHRFNDKYHKPWTETSSHTHTH